MLGQPQPIRIGGRDLRVGETHGIEALAREGHQLGNQLDAVHRCRIADQVRQQRGAPTGATADVEHRVAGLRVELGQHPRHRRGLGVRLTVADRKWPVLGGVRLHRVRQEPPPRDARHRRLHPICDPSLTPHRCLLS